MAKLVLLAVLIACPGIGYTQAVPCDPEVTKLVDPTNPTKYQPRGSRCEGVYDPERSGNPPLALVSFTSRPGTFDPRREPNLFVRWAVLPNSTAHLRAYSLKSRTYYQMDAALEPGKLPFVWPLDVVHDVGLKQREIAVVAWTSYKVGPVVQQVYVPVVVASGSSSVPQGSSPRISLLPGRELNEIFLSVQSLDPNLVPTKTLLKDYPLRGRALLCRGSPIS